MKKVLILFILLYGHVHALENKSTLKIYHEIFSALLNKQVVYVYTGDKEYRKVFETSEKIILTHTIEEADIILITNHAALFRIINKLQGAFAKGPILFVTDYRLLKYSPSIVGAFYWKKGRSQLLFIENRLDTFNVNLPQEYKNYIVETL